MPRGSVTTVPGAMVFNKQPKAQTPTTDAPVKKTCGTCNVESTFWASNV